MKDLSHYLQTAKDEATSQVTNGEYTSFDLLLDHSCGGIVGQHIVNAVNDVAALLALQLYQQDVEKEINKLQAFKDYVHKRLDDAGIEKDPESEHKEHGCRIGGRLDIVIGERDNHLTALEVASKSITELKAELSQAREEIEALNTDILSYRNGHEENSKRYADLLLELSKAKEKIEILRAGWNLLNAISNHLSRLSNQPQDK